MQVLNKILSRYAGEKSDLVPLLQEIQSEYGYLSEELMKEVSHFTNAPESEIYGVATFYTQFRFTPKGKKHISVCTGTACHVTGAQQIIEDMERHLNIKEGETTPDEEYSLESVGCLGCCALAPAAMVNDEIKSKLSLRNIKKLFKGYKPPESSK
ncbi:MAG: NADH-quinone oxidoreductase subunit NuoE [Euryarchaeota archaeon]|nr:NADH-quinone oxidoreductase subunit NuoE [Euryarchaeota archaeon]MBU4607108.1 NADH-quinone oxidoreductase subunit NuoE [Euryarchaeota archaeon]MBV1730193.1 NADH-quinone oxidoreductase subunit NuoE [Methanobacterium sp.]MBV1754657.1 NADH-quinone oxidoreductase subunit NuoE [Methanobacterium sp.]